MRAWLCYRSVVWSQQKGKLQHLVGQESTCDWCTTWTESPSLFFFSPLEKEMIWFVFMGRTLPRLVGLLPGPLPQLLFLFSSSSWHLFHCKSATQPGISSPPHIWSLTQHVPYVSFALIISRVWRSGPFLSFYVRPVLIWENGPLKHVLQRLNNCFRGSMLLLDSLVALWVLWLCEGVRLQILFLCCHFQSATETKQWNVKYLWWSERAIQVKGNKRGTEQVCCLSDCICIMGLENYS